jgi:hypothetical protein
MPDLAESLLTRDERGTTRAAEIAFFEVTMQNRIKNNRLGWKIRNKDERHVHIALCEVYDPAGIYHIGVIGGQSRHLIWGTGLPPETGDKAPPIVSP